MEPKRKIAITLLIAAFMFSTMLTVSFGMSYFEEKQRPLVEAEQQAESIAAYISNFELAAANQPVHAPTPTLTAGNAVLTRKQKPLLPTATPVPTPTPNPHAAELAQALSQVDINFPAWQSLNADVSAWISNPAVAVNHPIVNASDNEYYLTRDIDLSYKAMGSIFFDGRNNPDFSDRNTIIYGHNFDNGLMFSNLVWYKDQQIYEQHPYYYLYTPDKVFRVDIAAGIIVSETDVTYLAAEFHTDLDFRELIIKIKQNSVIDTEVNLTARDQIVTLYTCTNDWQGQRFVVIGKLTLLGDFVQN